MMQEAVALARIPLVVFFYKNTNTTLAFAAASLSPTERIRVESVQIRVDPRPTS